jgi:hypothetical protein
MTYWVMYVCGMSVTVAAADAVPVPVAVDKAESGHGEADTLNNLERLILAQAVYELGSDAWTSVSSILSQHPLIPKRDDATFSPSVSLSALTLILPLIPF